MSTTVLAPSAPRPSASLLLLSPSQRLLILQRPAHHAFGSAYVFPGGVMAAADGRSARLCAIRETFEETGVLLTTRAPPPRACPASAQRAVHAGSLDFAGWVAAWGGEFPAEMLDATTWITPPAMAKRYESRMFLARLPAWIDECAAVAGDGGVEAVGAPRWIAPRDALAAARAGDLAFFPPQLYLLSEIARVLARGRGWEGLREWAEWKGAYYCEPVAEAVLRNGNHAIGLGPRGDRDVVVMLEPGKKGTEPRAVGVVARKEMEELLAREKLEEEQRLEKL